jgi:hypothetical protein
MRRQLASLGVVIALGLSMGACSDGRTVFVDDGTGTPKPDSGAAPQGDDGGTTTDNDAATAPETDAATAPDTSVPADGFDKFQHHNLDVVNKYRAGKGVAALVLDKALCTFALAGSVELSSDHSPHQHFIDAGNSGTLWTSGFTSTAGENQGDPNGWTVLSSDPTTNEMDQIDAIQLAMYNEGPGTGEAHGHYMNMMNSAFTRLGVGLLEVSGHLYLTNDFSD